MHAGLKDHTHKFRFSRLSTKLPLFRARDSARSSPRSIKCSDIPLTAVSTTLHVRIFAVQTYLLQLRLRGSVFGHRRPAPHNSHFGYVRLRQKNNMREKKNALIREGDRFFSFTSSLPSFVRSLDRSFLRFFVRSLPSASLCSVVLSSLVTRSFEQAKLDFRTELNEAD